MASAGATLFFGFPFHDSDSKSDYPYNLLKDPYDLSIGWSTYYCEQHGLVVPEDPDDAYLARAAKLLKLSGCLIGWHDYVESPSFYVSVQASESEAWTHTTTKVPERAMMYHDKLWLEQLHAFCGVMHIKWQEPAWYLVTQLID